MTLPTNFRPAPRWQPRRQDGALTIFSAVILLGLLTLMLVYSTQAQRAEQRISANEYRQKLAFHAAESAADQALEYMLANSIRVMSAKPDAAPDGSGSTRPGWFDDLNGVWSPCPATPAENHPCGGELAAGNGVTSYFYDLAATTSAGRYDSMPVNFDMLPAGSTARVTAVLCHIDFNNPTGGCRSKPSASDDTAQASFVVTILAYGFADCTDTTNPESCLVSATVAVPMSSVSVGGGAPPVPLTSRTTFPPTGTAEIVPNPNAGGVGVPVSVWGNTNPACSSGISISGGGDWATCEYQEWYEADVLTPDLACGNATCNCSSTESISYTVGVEDKQGIDLLDDPTFPCDLFEFFFGVPRSQYQIVKSSSKIIQDCNSLGPNSHGVYWVSGSECRLDGTTVVGSVDNPVMLISAAAHTQFAGGAEFYGLIFITDVEVPTASWDAAGENTVYGSVISDAELGNFLGTFRIIYNEGTTQRAAAARGVGTLSGGWRDFGLPQISWEG